MCATRSLGRHIRPPLTPIPVTGCIGVDVIQFPRSQNGNQYAVGKWPEVFAVVAARLLVEEIVSRHAEALNDRGPAFLSKGGDAHGIPQGEYNRVPPTDGWVGPTV